MPVVVCGALLCLLVAAGGCAIFLRYITETPFYLASMIIHFIFKFYCCMQTVDCSFYNFAITYLSWTALFVFADTERLISVVEFLVNAEKAMVCDKIWGLVIVQH